MIKRPDKGPKAAADIINQLNPDEQKRILGQIAQSDPATAREIQENLVTLDDLQYITAPMLSELLKVLKPETLALALRTAAPATTQKILSLLPKRLAADFTPILSGPGQPKAKVFEACAQTLATIRDLQSKGKLVLKQGGDILV